MVRYFSDPTGQDAPWGGGGLPMDGSFGPVVRSEHFPFFHICEGRCQTERFHGFVVGFQKPENVFEFSELFPHGNSLNGLGNLSVETLNVVAKFFCDFTYKVTMLDCLAALTPVAEVGFETPFFFAFLFVQGKTCGPTGWVFFKQGQDADCDHQVPVAHLGILGQKPFFLGVPVRQAKPIGPGLPVDSFLGVFVEGFGKRFPIGIGRVRLPFFAQFPEGKQGCGFAKHFLEPVVALVSLLESAKNMADLMGELKGVLGPVSVTRI